MRPLILHPTGASSSISRVEASIVATSRGCHAEFVVYGDTGTIHVPAPQADRGRFDDLWRTTCFEIFWQAEGCTSYREFNLSPSTRWACYDFDAFRAGMRNAPAVVNIDVSVTPFELRLIANIESSLETPAKVALNGIIEDADGANRFWALDFAEGAPEFHNEICRSWKIEG